MKSFAAALLVAAVSVATASRPGAAAADAPLTLPLAGEWSFATDPGDVGEQEAWFAPEKALGGTIRLPGTTDEAGVGEPDADGPGLVRRHAYVGPAWYARDVEIPPEWSDQDVELTLERVIWKSSVWVDGKAVAGDRDSLSVAHRHALGRLAPGRHRLVVRIDNRKMHEIGADTHAYSENTQSRWNGVVGEMSLTARPATRLGRIRVFPGTGGTARVEAKLSGETAGAQVRVALREPGSGRVIAEATAPCAGDRVEVALAAPEGETVRRWSEFTPAIHTARVELVKDGRVLDARTETFGFRVISRDGNRLLLDGVPLFLRGNSESCNFLLHGYPSCRKEDWARIWAIYRAHGMNYARFHSWCPPEAAFAAADEAGIYLEIEGPFWCALGHGKPVDAWAKEEAQRIFDAYGNHPSFCLFEHGNELNGSNFQELGRWNAAFKQDDPRRLYAASTAREVTPDCDFNNSHIVHGASGYTVHYGKPSPSTAWNLEGVYGKSTVPIIGHEEGQVVTYPDWRIIDKASGTLRNVHMEAARARAEAADVLAENADFCRASGGLQTLLYKGSVEALMRTPSCRGFEFLAMQDFPGQGDAYVGWLDMFWDSKGFVTPEEFRGSCAPEVALAGFANHVVVAGQPFSADLLVRNDGPADMHDRRLVATLREASGRVLGTAECRATVPRGQVLKVGTLTAPVDVSRATALELELRLDGKPEANRYRLWAFLPDVPPATDPAVTVAASFSPEVRKALDDGGRVLLLAHALGRGKVAGYASWKPCFWSTLYFTNQTDTLGFWVNAGHPAFAGFPTGHFNDYQWLRLCEGGHGFRLAGVVPKGYRPLVQPVPDFHHQAKLGTIFEGTVGKGRLLVCGYDLTEARCRQIPEAAQLRQSLVRYAASDAFRPQAALDAGALDDLFVTDALVDRQLPRGFEKAAVFAAAAAEAKAGITGAGTDGKQDRLLACDDGYGITWLAAEGTIKESGLGLTGRYGPEVVFRLDVPRGVAGTLWVKFREYDDPKGRTVTIAYEDWRPEVLQQEPSIRGEQGQWWKLKIRREDALDGHLVFRATAAAHPKFAITHVAFVPEQ